MKPRPRRWFFFGLLALTLVSLACNLTTLLPSADEPTPFEEPRPTQPPPSETPIVEPSDTPLPLALPTETLAPLEPSATPTVLFTAALTFSPTPTLKPGVTVRIRNMTGYTVNLFRMGRSGEAHFLGWLGTGYYGIFQFPGMGEWVIRYCLRERLGDSTNCREKRINVQENDKEYRVP
jgi:hypothetical protein